MKLQLGFGDRDFAVNSDAGLLYDPDETDNLEKLLSELGKCILFVHGLNASADIIYRYRPKQLCDHC